MSKRDKDLDQFLTLADQLRLKTTNCENFKTEIQAAASVTAAFGVFRRYWQSVAEQIPDEFICVMSENYCWMKPYANAAGVYFNESPTDSPLALVFVGDMGHNLEVLDQQPRVIVLGKAKVTLDGKVRGECFCDKAEVTCRGDSRLRLRRGTAIAYDYSRVEGFGAIKTHDCSTAIIMGGELYDHGHLRIVAYNNAIIHSFTRSKIELYNSSQLILDL